MSKMKCSGVEWIGDIPENWNETRLKDIYSFEKGQNAQLYTQEYIGQHEGQYPVYSGQTENEGIMGKIDSYDYNLKECIFTTTVGAKCMNLKIISGKFSLSQNCLIMKQIQSNINKYIYYSLLPLFEYERSKIPAYMQPSLRIEDLNKYKLYLPSIDEQKLIANFLDEKIINLDNILLDLNKQLEILDRYKKQLITEAIKSGLEKNVNYVDSNKEWIGQINSTARLIRLKNYSYLKGRIGWQGLTADEFIDEGPYCVTGTDFINGKINWKTCYHISEKRYEMDYNIHLKVGDLLVTKDGTIGKLAKVNFLPDRACLNSHLLIIRPLTNDYTNEYLFYVMSSDIFKEYAKILANGSTMDSLSQEKIGNFIFPSYELKKQNEIVKYLDNKCSQIDKIIEEKQKQIEKIEEYKKSVIYEYVTGKKRVEGAEELYG